MAGVPTQGARRAGWPRDVLALPGAADGSVRSSTAQPALTCLRWHASLVNRDIVARLSVGFHEVPHAEDWPVLSREHLSFELKPSNFFDRNPALDLRRAPFEVR
ncbi:MAG TPA: hypothetical protein VFU71_22790 [Burkholderiaceae bacterium]|nr:hypothetical protein [Burkholderiaceae bacterium]